MLQHQRPCRFVANGSQIRITFLASLKSPLLSARCKSLRPLGFRRLCDDVCFLGAINDCFRFRHKPQPPRVLGGAHSPSLSLPPHSKTRPVKQGCEPPNDLILSDAASLTRRMSGLDGIESSSSNLCHSSVCDCTHKSAAQLAVWRRSESRWRWQCGLHIPRPRRNAEEPPVMT